LSRLKTKLKKKKVLSNHHKRDTALLQDLETAALPKKNIEGRGRRNV